MKKKTKSAGKILAPKRIDKVIEELPKHDYAVSQAALAAGYGKKYSIAGTKHLNKAIEKRINELAKEDPENDLIRGVWSRKELVGEYRKIVTQDKDMGTKLKAIAPLLQESGELPKSEEPNKTIPVLILNFGGSKIAPELESPSRRQIEAIEEDIGPSPDTP